MDEVEDFEDFLFLEKCKEKYKFYSLNERSNLFLRRRLIECQFDRLSSDTLKIINYPKHKIKDYLEKNCRIRCLPKEKREGQGNATAHIFSNKGIKSNEYSKYNFFIDCSAASQLICTAWTDLVGRRIDSRLKDNCYGNRLYTQNSEKYLYQQYSKCYRDWINDTTDKAFDLHKARVDQTILKLDIERYFYNVNLDVSQIEQPLSDFEKRLSIHVQMLHEFYSSKLGIRNNAIPLGLISSGVIANYALSEMDDEIAVEQSILHYGRYVDDIIIVINGITDDPKLKLKTITLTKNKKQILSNQQIFKLSTGKLKFYQIDRNESPKILEILKKELTEQSSEWRMFNGRSIEETTEILQIFNFLTESDLSFDGLNSTASLKYDLAKSLHEIQGFAMFQTEELFGKISQKLISLVNDTNIPELISFWERIFTFFSIYNSPISLDGLYTKIHDSIQSAVFHSNKSSLIAAERNTNSNNIQKDLLDILDISISSSASGNIEILRKSKLNQNENIAQSISYRQLGAIPRANTLFSGLYSNSYFRNEGIDFNLFTSDFNAWREVFRKINFDTDENKFTKYSDSSIATLVNALATNALPDSSVSFLSSMIAHQRFGDKDNIFLPPPPPNNHEEYSNDEINLTSSVNIKLSNLRSSVTSIDIEIKDLEKYLAHGKRYKDLVAVENIQNVLNSAIKEKSQIIVLPECSVPIQCMHLILNFCAKNKIIIIGGLKHIISDNYVYNIGFITIPINTGKYDDSYFIPFSKKHPSPREIEWINGHPSPFDKNIKLKPYMPITTNVEIIQVNNLFLSIFNCFELADIKLRASIKSKIDLLITIAANADTTYFSNIAESLTRDIHCFYMQSNHSLWGDSCVLAPKRREETHVIKLKGGDHPYSVTTNLDINKLRYFQMSGGNDFKPLPPGYRANHDSTKRKPRGD